MNARFWTYHPVADTFVKLTLKPGQTLSHYQSWVTDEGWSSTGTQWLFCEDGETVQRNIVDDGRDCDGRLTRFAIQRCPVDRLHFEQFGDVRTPAWADVSHGQHDYSAEAMGY